MDIVERLRKTAHEMQLPPTMELRQAADEIEKLQSALSFIAMARQPSMGQTWESHAIEIADYAAEKLKEKE